MDDDRLLRAQTWMQFTSALARHLTWPFFDLPGMVCLISLPLALLVALYFRPDFQEQRAAEFLLTFGLWGVLQSAGLAYGRGNYGEIIPASRYMDVLNIYVIASLFAVVLLPQCWTRDRFPQWAMTLLPLVFAGIIFFGLGRISKIVVENLLRPTRMMNLVAEERVETYWQTGDSRDFFEPPTVRPSPEVALGVLRDTNLQTILPAVCLPPASPPVAGRFAALTEWLLRNAVAILFSGLILFAGLAGYGLACGSLGLARANPAGIILWLATLTSLGFVWSDRSIRRESVEYGLQRDLAVYFKSVNDAKRAAIHERKADALMGSGKKSHAVP
jgi:hypothetical protein